MLPRNHSQSAYTQITSCLWRKLWRACLRKVERKIIKINSMNNTQIFVQSAMKMLYHYCFACWCFIFFVVWYFVVNYMLKDSSYHVIAIQWIDRLQLLISQKMLKWNFSFYCYLNSQTSNVFKHFIITLSDYFPCLSG